MNYNNRKWVIITLADYTAEELDVIVNDCIQSSVDTLRKNTNNTQAIVKYDGEKPSSLGELSEYTHEEILIVLEGNNWKGV